MSALWLAVRSLFWTLAFPGFFAFYAPWRWFGVSEVRLNWRDPLHVAGIVLVIAGATLLIACIVEFARRGRGTLSPADPPKELVVQGLYRYVRNPMYLGVMTIVLGEILLTRSAALLLYLVIWFTVASLFVSGYEEPTLRRQFGASYERYLRETGRWIPRGPQSARRNPQREG